MVNVTYFSKGMLQNVKIIRALKTDDDTDEGNVGAIVGSLAP